MSKIARLVDLYAADLIQERFTSQTADALMKTRSNAIASVQRICTMMRVRASLAWSPLRFAVRGLLQNQCRFRAEVARPLQEVSPVPVQVMGFLNVTGRLFSTAVLSRSSTMVKTVWRWQPQVRGIVVTPRESSWPGATRVDPVGGDVSRRSASKSLQHKASPSASIPRCRWALQNGAAQMVNDVPGGRADPAMGPLLAETPMCQVLMHWRAVSADALA